MRHFAWLLFQCVALAFFTDSCMSAPAIFITASDIPAMPLLSDWKECRDIQHGFSLRYPPDWHSTTPDGRCVQLQKGTSSLPHGIPEVDIYIEVRPLDEKFPDNYLISSSASGHGVRYTNRQELEINTLSAVRARFVSTAGPVPNWGVEYAIRKDDKVMKVYISQPKPEIEQRFDEVVSTLRW